MKKIMMAAAMTLVASTAYAEEAYMTNPNHTDATIVESTGDGNRDGATSVFLGNTDIMDAIAEMNELASKHGVTYTIKVPSFGLEDGVWTTTTIDQDIVTNTQEAFDTKKAEVVGLVNDYAWGDGNTAEDFDPNTLDGSEDASTVGHVGSWFALVVNRHGDVLDAADAFVMNQTAANWATLDNAVTSLYASIAQANGTAVAYQATDGILAVVNGLELPEVSTEPADTADGS